MAIEIKNKYGSQDIIISHNVLAHIENFIDVIEGANLLLKDDGKFVFEIGYFKSLIENKIYDTIYHEHLDYHTKSPLTNLLTKKGFLVEKNSRK